MVSGAASAAVDDESQPARNNDEVRTTMEPITANRDR